ncbi:heterotrimeric G protein alpha subunit [Marasmius fiardii PR-910]|nr:heterotrimeric G protein alpha subunit [Marasmius fiardii PR-910]
MFTLDDASDPFYHLMQPPAGETPEEASARLKREADAQRVSDAIDEDIKQHKALAKKQSHVLKVLLLGQAESDFRMQYDQAAWKREKEGWRTVVQLNLIRSIITITTLIEAELGGDVNLPFDRGSGDEEDGDDDDTTVGSISEHDGSKFGDRHHLLMIRLAPLRSVEADLQRVLGIRTDAIRRTALPQSATPFDAPVQDRLTKRSMGEYAVRCWRDVVHPEGRETKCQTAQALADLGTATATIAACKDDMKALWQDKVVQTAISRRRIRLPDSAGFFLNHLDRITAPDYSVTDDDIVRARLRTVGIQEYQVTFKTSLMDTAHGTWEWRIFDVGGCRTVRAAWLPFFENTNAIIFLCPVSCFDERLEEDYRVNRLEDSTLLWRSICSTKLLTRTQLVLFMNKCDLLKKKLKQGAQIKNSLTSYGDRPNEVMPFVKYLREKFKEILKVNSPEPRASYIYPTTVTDTMATGRTLESVRDGVLRENLIKSQLM